MSELYLSGYKLNNGEMRGLTPLQVSSIHAMRTVVWKFKSKQDAILTVG
ncbi:MAG: hypothetical protein IJ258_05415 [Methanobrevibacter sp.]|nr:hypothetical protein [Methanobrevibacter sp.]MBQ8017529.1 hypothetical protein [Methanobrevibacter sp.]